MNGLLIWINDRFPLFSTWKKYASDYYVPKNLNLYYCFGVLALLILVNQLLSGLWLAMFYTPTVAEAFNSVEYIMRDVRCGWILRYMHSTGASALYIVLYLHIFRGLLYGSYQRPRELVWILGMMLFILMITEAFFGYLLPWGQMSYWGAQVITSLVGAVPYVGDTLLLWLRGDYAVGNATLQRFFALHVIGVPLLVAFFVFLHIVALHHVGSNNPEGIDIKQHLDKKGKPLDGIPFYPFYLFKDLIAVLFFLLIFFAIVFFCPDFGGYFLDSTNFVTANPLITPEHIAPMWYLAPFYAMLRAIPDKLLGVVVILMALVILVFMPWLDNSPVRSLRYKGLWSKIALGALVVSFVGLGWVGLIANTPLRLHLARWFTVIYFAYFLLMPFYSRFERSLPVPERISV